MQCLCGLCARLRSSVVNDRRMAKELPVIQPGAQRQPGQPPIFQTSGSSGRADCGSIACGRARSGRPRSLSPLDDEGRLETAMRGCNAIDVAADDPIVLAEADIVILAAPVTEYRAAGGADSNVRQPAS